MPKCEDGGYYTFIPVGQTCDTISYNGNTCYTNCKVAGSTNPPAQCNCKLSVRPENDGETSIQGQAVSIPWFVTLSGSTCKSNADELTIEFPKIGTTGSCSNVNLTDHITIKNLAVDKEKRYYINTGSSGCKFMYWLDPGYRSYIVKINGVQASAAGGHSFKATDGSKCYLSYDGNY